MTDHRPQNSMSGISADAGVVARGRVTANDEITSTLALGHCKTDVRGRGPDHLERYQLESSTVVIRDRIKRTRTYLRIMAISLKVALANLLPMIRLILIHPRLARIRQSPAGALPVQILALAWALSTGTMLETGVSGGEILRPLLCLGDEMRVPDQVGAVDFGALADGFAG